MSMKINLIDLNRKRIALAYLNFCKKQYGGEWADIVISKHKGVRIDITISNIEALMKVYIENMLCAEFGIANAQKQVAASYDAMLDQFGKLTPFGEDAMDDMMRDAVAYKLENPDSTLLQVVSND
ncbi:hypothetical protein ABQ431_08225 [Serratia fonticola]|uniref:hypothetical protein n=1 Tax=Serratia fonticola TaxID=47917 RepID=UPI003AAF9390